MFGMGGTEILVILIVALLFLGPDKLPEAAKQISKGIRDIKKQSRALQQTIEDDEHIGGAIRDLKSALRGEDEPIRPRPIKAKPLPEAAAAVALPAPADESHNAAHVDAAQVPIEHKIHSGDPDAGPGEVGHVVESGGATEAAPEPPKLTLPPTAGERDPDEAPYSREDDAAELAQLVKPAPNTIARGAAVAPSPAPSSSIESPHEPSIASSADSSTAASADSSPETKHG